MTKWLLLVLVCIPPASSPAAVLSFEPDQLRAMPGTRFETQILLGATVGAYDLTFTYDPTLLTNPGFVYNEAFAARAPDDPEVFSLFTRTTLLPGGHMEVTLVSFLSPEALENLHTLELGVLSFDATSSSRSTISVSGLVSDEFGNPIDVTFQSAVVNAAVPEPGTLPLCASVFAALAAFLLRRRRLTV